MTKFQKDILAYKKRYPRATAQEIAVAFGVPLWRVKKALARPKAEAEKAQGSLDLGICVEVPAFQRPSGWREIFEFHKTYNPFVNTIAAKLFWMEMEECDWRPKDHLTKRRKHVSDWRDTFVRWLRIQRDTRKDFKTWAREGKAL